MTTCPPNINMPLSALTNNLSSRISPSSQKQLKARHPQTTASPWTTAWPTSNESTGESYLREPIQYQNLTSTRKLDRRIISAFWVLYFLCSAIRSNVGLAQTMNTDSGHDLASVLNLTRHEISTGLALFYVCYVIFDLPSNLIMTRLSPHVWMSRIVISVGLIGSCLAAMKAAWSF